MAAVLVFPGGRHRRPVLERVAAHVREARGLELLVAVASAEALVEARSWAEDVADDWIVASDADQLLAGVGSRPIRACFSYDEFGVELAATVAAQLGLPGTPPEVVREVQDKFTFRERCNQLRGCAQSVSRRLRTVEDLPEASGGRWPKVIKPARGGGSYFCRKVAGPEALAVAFEALSPQLQASKLPALARNEGFVVEEFVAGSEFDLDGVVIDGNFVFSLLSDNDPPMEPDFFERGGCYPSQLPAASIAEVLEVAAAVAASWPQLSGVVHFEGIVDQAGAVFPLEMNLRLGGAEAPACVLAASGVDLAPLVAAVALGDGVEPLLEARARPLPCARSTNVQLESSCERVLACGPLPGLEDAPGFVGAQFYCSPGERYGGTGSQRTAGWVAAAGDSAGEAEENLRHCLELCEFRGYEAE